MSAGKASYTGLQMELAPDSPKCKAITQMVLDRKKYSDQRMKDARARFNAMDESFKAYIPVKEVDAKKKTALRTEGKLDYITLSVPYSYAVAMTAHTYLSSVFLSRSPIYQFSGRHGETQNSIQAVEAIMDYQARAGRHLPVLMNWLFSACKYGIGFIGSYWCKETAEVSRLVEKPVTLMGMPVPFKTKKEKEIATVTSYEGNRLYNISVHDVYPDPRVPLWNFQEGEFFGRDVRVGTHEILEGAAAGRYFNVEQLLKQKQSQNKSYDSIYGGQEQASQVLDLPYMRDTMPYNGPSFHTLHEMTIRLVPADWGLGQSKNVEKWVFTVANNELLIGAQPLGLLHNRFPAEVIEYGLGAEEFIKSSMIEVIKPLSDALTWLFNSHMYGVRKSLNDTRVVDPSRVTIQDMTQPFGGTIIRLKPRAYGQNPREMIHQLTTQDPTQGHPNDMAIVENMMQRALGVVHDVMGVQDVGSDRQTATEVRTRTGFSTSRMKTTAEYFAAVGFGPLAQTLLMNTQQLMSQEREYRIAGSLMQDAVAYQAVKVTPDNISGFYDYVPIDGSLPIDRLAQANFWKEMIMMISGNPLLIQQWDVSRLVEHAMSIQGERNATKFRIGVMGPQQLQQQLQAGNVVPIGGQNGQQQTRLGANLGATGTGTSGGTF